MPCGVFPACKQAAFTSLLPLSDDPPVDGMYGAQFEDQGRRAGHNVFRYAISPGYCQTMGIPCAAAVFSMNATRRLPRRRR